MSAFVVSKVHVDLLVKTAVRGPRLPDGAGVCPDWAWTPFSYYAHEWADCETPDDFYAGRRDGRWENRHELGAVLVSENVRSVMHRYPDTLDGASLPGPIDAYWEAPYAFEDPGYQLTAVEALSALRCFEYQSCECPDWSKSEAHAFCDALATAVTGYLPGYRAAPWEWTSERVDQARQQHRFSQR
jgi:hypothetical protein